MPVIRLLIINLIVMIPFLSGCSKGGNIEVEGTITYEGKPIPGAEVEFASEKGDTIYTTATDAKGHFKLTSPNGDGAPAGKYKVTILFWLDRKMQGEYPPMTEQAEDAKARGIYKQAVAEQEQTIEQGQKPIEFSLTKKSIRFEGNR